jgi:general secretion pathway protein J
MARPAHFDVQGGFTLLELLIVITILGLILTALSSGVRFAGQAWRMQQSRSARQGDLDSVQNVVRGLLVSGTAFDGDSGSLRFVSTLPAALGRAGLYDLDLHTTSDILVLAWRPHFKGPSQQTGAGEAELTKDVAGMELSYYYSATAGWEHASHKNKSPALVEVTLVLSDGRVWPSLVAAPMVDVVPAVAN